MCFCKGSFSPKYGDNNLRFIAFFFNYKLIYNLTNNECIPLLSRSREGWTETSG